MSIWAPENKSHQDMTGISGGECHEFRYEYVTKILIKPRVVGNSMFFAPKIILSGSYAWINDVYV